MKSSELALYFDHTNLKPEAGEWDIRKLCSEAKEFGFYGVCVNSAWIEFAAELLVGSPVKPVAVVGFPLGACGGETKAFEADLACKAGAREIDMVLAIGALKDGRDDFVKNEIASVVAAANKYGALVKVIFETCLLTGEEIGKACRLSRRAGAAFVKTSTGFSIAGAKEEDVRFMKQAVGNEMKVKASGGIRNLATALSMIEAGADRLGASASVEILNEYISLQGK